MEEKIYIQSEQYKVKKFFWRMVIIGIVLSLLLFAFYVFDMMGHFDRYYSTYLEHRAAGSCGSYYDQHGGTCFRCEEVRGYSSIVDYGIGEALKDEILWLVCAGLIAGFAFVGGFVYYWLRGCKMIVTDRRIYGKVAWGKDVEIPADSVSRVSRTWLLKGIAISTASGKKRFRMMKNRDEILRVLGQPPAKEQAKKQNSLASAEASGTASVKKQETKQNSLAKPSTSGGDPFEQIKKFKELLDMGIITQEEFDAKKKQLLGL